MTFQEFLRQRPKTLQAGHCFVYGLANLVRRALKVVQWKRASNPGGSLHVFLGEGNQVFFRDRPLSELCRIDIGYGEAEGGEPAKPP